MSSQISKAADEFGLKGCGGVLDVLRADQAPGFGVQLFDPEPRPTRRSRD